MEEDASFITPMFTCLLHNLILSIKTDDFEIANKILIYVF